MKIKIAILLLVPLAFSCSTVEHIRTNDVDKNFQKTDLDKVEVYSTANAGREYYVLGTVVAMADTGEDSEKPVELLKEEATKMGADAIIMLKLEFGPGEWDIAIRATSTAVKFK